jgi:predicted DNA-binding ribbon-helix-helix protein
MPAEGSIQNPDLLISQEVMEREVRVHTALVKRYGVLWTSVNVHRPTIDKIKYLAKRKRLTIADLIDKVIVSEIQRMDDNHARANPEKCASVDTGTRPQPEAHQAVSTGRTNDQTRTGAPE